MIAVPAIEIVGMLLLALVLLRATWLALHPAAHHAALRPAHWAHQVDRAMHTAQHRA
ncbi:hypothetical protein F4692_003720 [Nocardioides cavernae]|uniref:Uncharacterized protein n=1 Tax=Nocardioides cavernae TaxID=1921566 RepID=A0A7Y9H626_9ACTN|nr:hypothetical protein [Nocardioides cavernae]NYE38570.1 hypothetical protein [Nocardioides cavernae]